MNSMRQTCLTSLGQQQVREALPIVCAAARQQATRHGLCAADRDDLEQTAWLALCGAIGLYRPLAGPYSHWAATVVRNACRDHVRRVLRYRRRYGAALVDVPEVRESRELPSLAPLSPSQAGVVRHRLAGHSHAETARLLGITCMQSRQLASRAVRELRASVNTAR